MGFGGDLKTMPLPDILQYLNLWELSGVLEIFIGKEVYKFYFSEGKIIHFRSTRLKDHIGQYLLRSHVIDAECLRKALQEHKKKKSDLISCIAQQAKIDNQQLAKYYQKNAETLLQRLFVYHHGRFKFREKSDLVAGDLVFRIDFQELVLSSRKRIAKWQEFIEKLPEAETVLVVDRKALDGTEQESLEAMDRAVIKKFESAMRIIDGMDALTADDYEVCSSIVKLLDLGILNIQKDEPVIPASERKQGASEEHRNFLSQEARRKEKISAIGLENRTAKAKNKTTSDIQNGIKRIETASKPPAEVNDTAPLRMDSIEMLDDENVIPVLNISLTSEFLSNVNLSEKEGYLLSRIDGVTNLKGLSVVSGMTLAQTKRMIAKLLQENFIRLQSPKKAKQKKLKKPAPIKNLESEKKVSQAQLSLMRSYIQDNDVYGILNVSRASSPSTIEKNFNRLISIYSMENYDNLKNMLSKGEIEKIRQALKKAYRIITDQDKLQKYLEMKKNGKVDLSKL